MASALDDFEHFLRRFGKLVAGVVAATALVFIAAFADIAPPWPQRIVEITAVLQLVVLVLVFQFLRSKPRATINRIIVRSVALLGVSFLCYLVFLSLLNFEIPTNGERGVRGFFCTQDAIDVYGSYCPFLTPDQLADANYTVERLWTPLGLLAGRVSLVILWLVVFGSLAYSLGAFIAFQMRQKPQTRS